jgi:8-oxo-dGTP pyrophosphatase MutT (NUDIX family)
MCKHNTCNRHRVSGVGAILINRYSKGNINIPYAVLFGKERGGKYTGKYNLFGGNLDSWDEHCAIYGIIRELKEEAKIDLSDWRLFDSVFRASTGIRYFMMSRTMIFVGILPPGFSRTPIKNQMLTDCYQHPRPEYREMDDAEWFDAISERQIESKLCYLSSYAKEALSIIRSREMFGL